MTEPCCDSVASFINTTCSGADPIAVLAVSKRRSLNLFVSILMLNSSSISSRLQILQIRLPMLVKIPTVTTAGTFKCLRVASCVGRRSWRSTAPK